MDTSARCCRPGSVYAVVLNVAVVLLSALYFTLQATTLPSLLTGIAYTRRWLKITPTIEAMVWVVCLPTFLLGVYVLGQMTCCWQRTLRRDRTKSYARRSTKPPDPPLPTGRRISAPSRSLVRLLLARCYRDFKYYRSRRSPFYLWKLYASECWEFLWQALAVVQFSEAGTDKLTLILYTTTILLNALSPLALIVIQRNHHQRNRKQLGLSVRRLLLFDATWDVLYAFFPVMNVLFRLRFMKEAGRQTPTIEAACKLAFKYARLDCNTVAAYMMLGETRQTLFGGDSLAEVAIKMQSRMLPLVLAPLRLRAAFILGFGVPDVIVSRAEYSGDPSATTTVDDVVVTNPLNAGIIAGGELELRPATREMRVSASTSSKTTIRSSTSTSATSTASRPRFYYRLPLAFPILLSLAMASFSIAIIGQLVTWPSCPDERIRLSCVIPNYQLFDLAGLGDKNRGCGCNMFFFGADPSCASPNATSTLLRKHPRILHDLRFLFLVPCKADTEVAVVIDELLRNPLTIMLFAADHTNPTPSAEALPPNERWDLFAAHRMRPGQLAMLQVIYLNGLPATLSPELWRLTSLLELRLDNIGLQSFPAEMGQLANLLEFSANENNVTRLAVPHGHLTNLHHLMVIHNAVTHIPEAFFKQFSAMEIVNMHHNRITRVPASLASDCVHLTRVQLIGNQLRALPPGLWSLAKLTALHVAENFLTCSVWDGLQEAPASQMEAVDFQMNEIDFVPPAETIGKLTRLTDLALSSNPLTQIPLPLGNFERLKRIKLQRTRLTELSIQGHFGGAPSLVELQLSSNPLHSLSADGSFVRDLAGLPELQSLELENISAAAVGVLDELVAAVASSTASTDALPTRRKQLFVNLQDNSDLVSWPASSASVAVVAAAAAAAATTPNASIATLLLDAARQQTKMVIMLSGSPACTQPFIAGDPASVPTPGLQLVQQAAGGGGQSAADNKKALLVCVSSSDRLLFSAFRKGGMRGQCRCPLSGETFLVTFNDDQMTATSPENENRCRVRAEEVCTFGGGEVVEMRTGPETTSTCKKVEENEQPWASGEAQVICGGSGR